MRSSDVAWAVESRTTDASSLPLPSTAPHAVVPSEDLTSCAAVHAPEDAGHLHEGGVAPSTASGANARATNATTATEVAARGVDDRAMSARACVNNISR